MITDQKVNKGIVGVYLIDGIMDGPQLATTKKPSNRKRFFTRLFLGWRWVSVKEIQAEKKELYH